MNELEKVEKLREKADITFAEAKEALENSNGDILDALILLENQGKVAQPTGGGNFSSESPPATSAQSSYSDSSYASEENAGSGEEFADLMKRFAAFCLKVLDKGLNNHLEATKGDQYLFSIPVIIVAILILFFWVTVPLFVISLFFGFRYRFTGRELGRKSVNKVMDSASDVAEDVKKSFTESNKPKEKGD